MITRRIEAGRVAITTTDRWAPLGHSVVVSHTATPGARFVKCVLELQQNWGDGEYYPVHLYFEPNSELEFIRGVRA